APMPQATWAAWIPTMPPPITRTLADGVPVTPPNPGETAPAVAFHGASKEHRTKYKQMNRAMTKTLTHTRMIKKMKSV
ncbi:MAG: hypothetical protein R6T91_00280, partial [Bacteroidales bacterium]